MPVVTGMILSIPLSVLTSRSAWGEHARAAGLFLTPEETCPPPEIARLRERMVALDTANGPPALGNSGLADVVLDPYINAIHVSLQREKRLNPTYAEALAKFGVGKPAARALGEKLLAEGPENLQPQEKLLVLSDADVMVWLHRQAWLRSADTLAAWWQPMIRRYARR